MLSRLTEIKRVLMVRINPGEDILLGLRQAVKIHGIRNAAIRKTLANHVETGELHGEFHFRTGAEEPRSKGSQESEASWFYLSRGGFGD